MPSVAKLGIVVSQSNLHDKAVQAEASVEALATDLAKAGADDDMVDAVTKLADELRSIAGALVKGQEAAPAQQPADPQRPSLDSATADLHRDVLQGTHGGAY